LGHEHTDWLWLWVGDLLGHLHVGWGDGGNDGSWSELARAVWSWGGGVVVVVVRVVWWVWIVSNTSLGSGSISSGGVWSSGGWVGVVMWNGSWLSLVAWGSNWSILWSVGSIASLNLAVNAHWAVSAVAWWELGSLGSSNQCNDGEFHYNFRLIYYKFIMKVFNKVNAC
jgi:hypothetical protein